MTSKLTFGGIRPNAQAVSPMSRSSDGHGIFPENEGGEREGDDQAQVDMESAVTDARRGERRKTGGAEVMELDVENSFEDDEESHDVETRFEDYAPAQVGGGEEVGGEGSKAHSSEVLRCAELQRAPAAAERGSTAGSTLQHTATHCNTLQHTATHCNTLQCSTTHCCTPVLKRALAAAARGSTAGT